MLTEKEKRYYNLHLSISRSSRNKPYRIRENFEKFEDKDYICIKKIVSLFDNYPQLKPHMFFKAPYELYKDTDYFNLEFFTTRKAIKAYTTYMKQLDGQLPDHQIDFIKSSLKFIGTYCIENNISIKDYPTHRLGSAYAWMIHLKMHDISIYSLMEYNELYNTIKTIPLDERDLLLGSLERDFYSYKTKYMQSSKAKIVVKEGMQKINSLILNK